MALTLAGKVVFAKGCPLPCRLCVASSGSFVSVALVERGVVGTSSSSCSSSGWLSLDGGSKRGVTRPLWQVSTEMWPSVLPLNISSLLCINSGGECPSPVCSKEGGR